MEYSDNTLPKSKPKAEYWDTAKSLLIAVFLALVVRTFLFEPFHIPSGSMKSTLEIGDYIFVSKYSYGYSKYSFPLSPPLFDGRLLDNKPERGDVIVFRLPSDTSINYIKRLVGLPGDTIRVRAGVLYINDKAVPRKYVGEYLDIEGGTETKISQYRETMPNGLEYGVLDQQPDSTADNTYDYIVPEGNYFFMGDNRDNSKDSRFIEDVGFVPADNLIGRAEIKILPDGWTKPWNLFEKVNVDRSKSAVIRVRQ